MGRCKARNTRSVLQRPNSNRYFEEGHRKMIKTSFNEGWYFGKDEGGMFAVSSEMTPVRLPHDAMILEPRDKNNTSRSTGGYFPGGNYMYSKTFFVPKEDEGKTLVLRFEGVYNQAQIYVNGDFVCGNQYGYTEFHADISGYLHYGEENVIQVKAVNGNLPNSRWYTGSGIYRPVWKLSGGELCIGVNGLKITTKEASEDVSQIETAIYLNYKGCVTRKIRICTEIKEKGGTEVVQKEETVVTLYSGEEPIIRQCLYLTQVKLWSTDTPNLYTCTVKIYEENERENVTAGVKPILDETEETFGIRHIQVDPVYGFRINGKKVLLRGACIHHDNGVIGAATYASAEERRIRIIKEAGFNAIRIAHNPSSRALLEACDKFGVLVMEESFDMWNHSKTAYDYSMLFDKHWEAEVEALVAKDYNHPSVIMYSIGNEIQEVGTGAGARLNRKIAEKFRSLDSTRYITNAINGLLTVMDKMGSILTELNLISDQNEKGRAIDINDFMTAAMGNMDTLIKHPLIGERIRESAESLDISGYNYMTGRYEMDSKKHSNRIIVGSETYAPQIAENWKHVKENPAIIGDFTWTGYDYIGEAGIGVPGYDEPGGFLTPYPCFLANVGDIDIIGYRRPMSYYREIVWGLRKNPYIAVQSPDYYGKNCTLTPWINEEVESCWTWPESDGKSCRVEVYSCDEEVELFVNGSTCGRMKTGESQGYKAVFDTVYYTGKVTAISYNQGKETGRYEVPTAESEEHLCIETTCKKINSGGEDLAFLLITLRDKQGTLHMNSRKKISVNVSGAGELLGFGSADPFSTENFYDAECTIYRGAALAVIRSVDTAGEILFQVKADGCEPAEVILYASAKE